MPTRTENTERVLAELEHANVRPQVAVPARPWVMPLAMAGAVMLGVVVFLELNAGRTHVAEAQETTLAAPPQAPQPAPPPQVAPPPAPMASSIFEGQREAAASQAAADRAARLSSRAMIVDLSEPQDAQAQEGGGGQAVSARDVTDAVGGANDAFGQGSNEMFASRLNRSAASARAQPPGDLSNIVPEGAVIPAVLETALNSDLPGYTRAIVSRDVLSFDNSKVLVPRGSRLIGQYRSAVALGQSRAFVIWTRLVRPDGVSVQIADPGADALGRGGLQGRVDTHFMRRFGGAILLSLITAGANAAAADSSDTQVIIANTRGATDSAASGISNVAPTVDVPQGAPIRIFVTRDLDFSDVSPAR
ncbi:MAG TPA: TrbI/VirB10 family protein [Caulobacterales bacterium]|nr:TrbI/VirB10 family protein [Caulobacterales bacterium]